MPRTAPWTLAITLGFVAQTTNDHAGTDPAVSHRPVASGYRTVSSTYHPHIPAARPYATISTTYHPLRGLAAGGL